MLHKISQWLSKHAFIFAGLIIALSGCMSYVLSTWLVPNIAVLLILQLGVVTVALVTEKPPALFAGLLGALVFNYFFTEPLFSMRMTQGDDIANTIVFLIIAFITSQLANYYRHQREALKQAQLRSNILLSVSHDLRTPLSTIIGSLTSLLEYQDKLEPEKKMELFSGALEESHRLHHYIENLLQATKMQHGEFKLNVYPESIVPVIQKTLARFDSSRVVFVAADDIPIVSIRASLFEQALYNLIDNAIRFSPIDSKVTITLHGDQEHLILRVIDQGPGIPLKDQQKVFELFYSSRKGDKGEGGTGLGLAVSSGIVTAHGGNLEVEHTQIGCCMRLSLPIVKEDNE